MLRIQKDDEKRFFAETRSTEVVEHKFTKIIERKNNFKLFPNLSFGLSYFFLRLDVIKKIV